MKHGRRHDKLKEQAYLARKDAEGYNRPYRAMDVAQPAATKAAPDPPPEEGVPLAAKLNRKQRKQLAWHGVDPEEEK